MQVILFSLVVLIMVQEQWLKWQHIYWIYQLMIVKIHLLNHFLSKLLKYLKLEEKLMNVLRYWDRILFNISLIYSNLFILLFSLHNFMSVLVRFLWNRLSKVSMQKRNFWRKMWKKLNLSRRSDKNSTWFIISVSVCPRNPSINWWTSTPNSKEWGLLR